MHQGLDLALLPLFTITYDHGSLRGPLRGAVSESVLVIPYYKENSDSHETNSRTN